MNNFELDSKAKELEDQYSAYRLARMYLELKEILEEDKTDN